MAIFEKCVVYSGSSHPSRGRGVPATGCLRASPQASARLALISLKLSTSSSETVILASAFRSSYLPMRISESRGM